MPGIYRQHRSASLLWLGPGRQTLTPETMRRDCRKTVYGNAAPSAYPGPVGRRRLRPRRSPKVFGSPRRSEERNCETETLAVGRRPPAAGLGGPHLKVKPGSINP